MATNVESRKLTDRDRIIGRRMRIRRVHKRMTIKMLAAVAGVSPQHYSKYETGEGRINIARLELVAAHLQAPLTYFFETSNVARIAPALIVERMIAEKGGFETAKLFLKLDNSKRVAWYAAGKAMLP